MLPTEGFPCTAAAGFQESWETRTLVELGFASDKVLGIFRTMVLVKELKVLQDRDKGKSIPLILKGRDWR